MKKNLTKTFFVDQSYGQNSEQHPCFMRTHALIPDSIDGPNLNGHNLLNINLN